MSEPSLSDLRHAEALLTECCGSSEWQVVADVATMEPSQQRWLEGSAGTVAFARIGQQQCPRCLTPLVTGYDNEGVTLGCSKCEWNLREFIASIMAHEAYLSQKSRRRTTRYVSMIAGGVLGGFFMAVVVFLAIRTSVPQKPSPKASDDVPSAIAGPKEHVTLVPLSGKPAH